MENKMLTQVLMAAVALLLGIALLNTLIGEQAKVTELSSSTESFVLAAGSGLQILENGDINTSSRFSPAKVTESLSGWRSTNSECGPDKIILGTYANSAGSSFAYTTNIITNSEGYFTLTNVNSTKVLLGYNLSCGLDYSCYIGDNTVVATLPYCSDEYLNSSIGQKSLKVAIGLFALGLLALSIGLFYNIAKEQGWFKFR